MTYEWEWKWHAETAWVAKGLSNAPDESEIDSLMREKVAQEMVMKFTAKGFSLTVNGISTAVDITRKTRYEGTRYEKEKWVVDGATTTEFDTDAPVFGSPIEPATIALIGAVVVAVIGLVKVALLFVVFTTAEHLVRDIGTGFSEIFGGGEFSGLAILFLLAIGILGLLLIFGVFGRRK